MNEQLGMLDQATQSAINQFRSVLAHEERLRKERLKLEKLVKKIPKWDQAEYVRITEDLAELAKTKGTR